MGILAIRSHAATVAGTTRLEVNSSLPQFPQFPQGTTNSAHCLIAPFAALQVSL